MYDFIQEKLSKRQDYEKSLEFLKNSIEKINTDYINDMINSINFQNRAKVVKELKLLNISRVKVNFHIIFVLNYLFQYDKTAWIPLDFFGSEIGRLILEAYKIPQDILISASNAAMLLDCSRQKLHYQKNRLKTIKIGNGYFFKLSDILSLID